MQTLQELDHLTEQEVVKVKGGTLIFTSGGTTDKKIISTYENKLVKKVKYF